MKKLLIVSLLCMATCLATDPWTTEEIPLGGGSGVPGAYNNVAVTYDETNKLTVAAWRDGVRDTTADIYYSVFDGTSWSTGALLFNAVASSNNNEVTLIYVPSIQRVLATWANGDEPYYSLFDGTDWATPAAINQGSSTAIWTNIGLAYNSSNHTVVALWNDNNDPYYSVFNGTTWTAAQAFTLGDSSGVGYAIGAAYDAINNKVIAAWGDRDNSGLPYYATFNGSSWSTPSLIGMGTGADYSIALAFNPINGTVVGTWGDWDTLSPFYSVYNGTSWTTPTTIPQGASAGVNFDTGLVYDTFTRQIITTWGDFDNFVPYYSTFDGTAWATAQAMPIGNGNGVQSDVFSAYHAAVNKAVAVWADEQMSDGPSQPYASLYYVNELGSPQGLIGKQKKNDFGLVYEIFNTLTWGASSGDVAGYNIYRNGVRIATIPSTALSYEDHNIKKKSVNSYSVTAVDASLNEGPAANLTIP